MIKTVLYVIIVGRKNISLTLVTAAHFNSLNKQPDLFRRALCYYQCVFFSEYFVTVPNLLVV